VTKPRARIYRGTSRNLAALARRLRAGEIVAVPTETVYGLAANALDPRACRKIFRAKGRPTTDPLIVHVGRLEQLHELCEVNDAARRLAKKFWPGPLTLVLPKKSAVPDIVTAGRDSVAVRMPRHPLLRRLLEHTGLPLAAPSANPFGYISPTTAEHVRENLGHRIAHILDGGTASIGLESTIVDLRDAKNPRLLRPGAITREQLAAALRHEVKPPPRSRAHAPASAALAPGMLARHYSPRTPLRLHARLRAAGGPSDEAFVFLRRPTSAIARKKNVFWLDERGELRGVARRLFATLRRVDAMRFRKIHAELASGGGLADAINDRLRRAAAQ